MASPLNKLVSGFRAATQRRKANSPGGPDADPAAPAGRLPPGAAARYGILVGGQSTEDELEAALNDLPAGYFDPAGQFDALEHELRQLPVNFDAEALEVVAEGRTAVLEVVSEKLSAHVIHNYAKFVAGVGEVARVEAEVQAAHITAKRSREALALAQREVNSNLRIAKDTRRKQDLTALLEALLKLQQANNLQRALKEAQEEGEFAEAFFLCAQCIRSMEELGEGLRVAQQLTVTINGLYAETTERLEGALAAVCSDFRPSHYTKVLEGYMFLGNVEQLGLEVQSAFAATISASVTKVVRGVLLTRPGFEEKAAVAGNLQELLRYLPSDLFRTCLARVLMVLFDILVSHFHMVRWHEAALERHAEELAALQATRHQLAAAMDGGGGGGDGGEGGEGDTAAWSQQQQQQQHASTAAAPGSDPFRQSWVASSGAAPAPVAAAQPGTASSGSDQWQQRGGLASGESGSLSGGGGDEVTVIGRAAMQLRRGTASELEEVEARTSDEAEWGLVLQAVHDGLLAGRGRIWEEAAGRVGVLLSSPAAFEGEHFLQVMDWTQRLLAVGEAFSGSECAALQALLERQSGKFFRLYHHSNIEALSSMLDKELWKRLPAELPSLAAVLRARSSSAEEVAGGGDGNRAAMRAAPASASGSGSGSGSGSASGCAPSSAAAAAGGGAAHGIANGVSGSAGPFHPLADFERYVVQGNPWRKQRSPRRRHGGGGTLPQQLGFGGSAGADADDSRGARLLDVDEYGVPRTASNAPSGGAASRPGSGSTHSGSAGAVSDSEAEAEDGTAADDEGAADGMVLRPGGGGGGGEQVPAVTNSSWRMYKWMWDYAQLMRPLRSAAPSIFAGLCELFELYMLHVFVAFSDISIAELQRQAATAAHPAANGGGAFGSGFGGGSNGGGGSRAESLSPRLRATLLRIAGDSIGKYRQLFASQTGSKLARALGAGGVASGFGSGGGGTAAAPGQSPAPAAAAAGSGGSQYFRRTLPAVSSSSSGGGPAAAAVGHPAAPPGATTSGAAAMPAAVASAGVPAAAEISVVSHPGNLYGLLERATAADSLLAVAAELQQARAALGGVLPPGEGPALDSFLSRTVGAAEDLQDFLIRTAARLLLPLRWLPDRLSAATYVLAEPPTVHAAWVDELRRHLEVFRDRLAQVPGLEPAAVARLWGAAASHVGEACLEGIARVQRCSLEGRAAMSLDLQGVQRALSRLLPPGVPLNLRLVDSYVKAFYIPFTDLPHWAATHPEYSPQQVLALAACVAESSGMKKRDKAALIAQVEGDLRALSLGGPGGNT